MRLIDADKLKPDCLTTDGKFAISQSQIANAPIFEERPKGKWIDKHMKEDYTLVGTCSICRERTRIGNFCRMCGADMRGEKE